MSWEKIGIIGVDAGCCWVGDPCYCITPDGDSHPASTWEEFCKILQDKNFDEKGYLQFNYKMGHPGLGVLVQTGCGDGSYPVYIKKNDRGEIVGLKIDFDCDDEDG